MALVFPSNLGDMKSWVKFRVKRDANSLSGGETNICFPLPPNLTFANAASYDNIDLGFLGKAILDNGVNLDSSVASGVAAITSQENIKRSIIAGIKKAGLPSNAIAGAEISSSKVFNPNTHVAFDNVQPRVFNFSFKMVPEDEDESEVIDSIIKTFMVNLYPDSNDDLYLNFPSTWEIDFTLNNNDDNKFIPKINTCFLTDCSITYNESTNLYHSNGAPAETIVTLTFRETKALKAKDIK